MKSTVLLLSGFLFSLFPLRDAEQAAIYQAVFTHQDIESALIHVPRYEPTPTQLILLQNEFTEDVEIVPLRSAQLVVMDEEELIMNKVMVFYSVDEFEISRNTATVSFKQYYQPRGQGYREGDYTARVSLARKNGEWIATRVIAKGNG